jgi:hypothetical protein
MENDLLVLGGGRTSPSFLLSVVPWPPSMVLFVFSPLT